MKVKISKTFDFDAAHWLPHVADGHKCKRMHGHTYRVEVMAEDVGRGEDPWYALESDRAGVIFYLGDFDPSGEDMVRDITERMQMFGCGDRLIVKKIGLTWAQIQHFKPPPNPAKMDDPRAAEYIAKHGRQSWEVDSLDPPELARLVTSAFKSIIEQGVLDEVLTAEAEDKKALTTALEKVKRR